MVTTAMPVVTEGGTKLPNCCQGGVGALGFCLPNGFRHPDMDGFLNRHFLMISEEHIDVSEERKGVRITSTYTIHTPEGKLCYVEAADNNTATTWITELLPKDKG